MSLAILTTAIALAAWSTGVQGQSSGCVQIAGNYYCGQTNAVLYNNVGFNGQFNSITSMDNSSCTCSSSPQPFSGPLAPLNEEISLHLRGPFQLHQLAIYHRSSSSKVVKRDAEAEADHEEQFPALGRHKRGHGHRHDRRGYGKIVTVTETEYLTSTRRRHHSSTSTSCTTVVAGSPVAVGSVAAPAPAPAASVGTTTPVSSGDWTRDSFYEASSGTATNLVFQNHMGGTAGSGCWDSCFGNSLSYASSDGVSGAGSAQVLGNVVIPSNKELAVFSSKACGSNDCGFYRPGTPAYRGFDTSTDMVMLIEFTMPRDSGSGFNVDMPAVWILNAQIPRTLQYGNAQCSCWTTGCGELDLFEILSAGSDYLTTTLHSWQGTNTQYGGGGCSNYFQRPLTGTMSAAIIFTASTKTIHIVTIPAGTSFDAGLADSTLSEWTATTGAQVNIPG